MAPDGHTPTYHVGYTPGNTITCEYYYVTDSNTYYGSGRSSWRDPDHDKKQRARWQQFITGLDRARRCVDLPRLHHRPIEGTQPARTLSPRHERLSRRLVIARPMTAKQIRRYFQNN